MATYKKKRAKTVKQRKPKYLGFPSDAESVDLRRHSAAEEQAVVRRLGNDHEFYGDFEVSSTQWEHPYIVEIRSLTEPINTCSCQDHRMNRLGTCKHVERVLQVLAHRRKRRFKAAAEAGSPSYDLFFDERQYPPVFRLRRPVKPSSAVEKRLAPLFSSDRILVGAPSQVWPALEQALAGISTRVKSRTPVRLSGHCDYWLERERHERKQGHLRRSFEEDVAAGKRSDNPVNLPLYPYQKQGMLHLACRGRALLADEMGLGKTVQAIAAVELLRQLGEVRRVLVVSPASLKAEWEEQIRQFTGIDATPVYGSRATRLRAYTEEHAYTLCNYEQIRVDVDDINRLMVPDVVILDEAQRIKNWPTKTAKTIKRLRSPYAFVLTGTPMENRIEELYSLVEFIDPHVFGSLFRFQRAYMKIGVENEIIPQNLDQLHRQASTVMLRRRKSDVEDDLPGRTDKNFYVTMTEEQQKRYAEYEYEAAKVIAILKRRPLRKEEHDRLQMVLACMRMTCDTPFILDDTCRDCPKLDEVEAILDDILEDDSAKIIIFSEWVRMLQLVKELLDAKGIGYAEHTGKIPQKQRRSHIKRFKDDADCRIFLSSESGGTGLNLQAANVVMNLDLPWNPAKLEQRIARAWRKHQTRTVRVINLVAKDTIEEGMLGKLAYKTALADTVLDGAEFQESLKTAGGRLAFADRVAQLLGGEPVSRAKSADAARPDPAKRQPTFTDNMTAQFGDSILGIEVNRDTGSTLVVARPDSSMGTVQRHAQATAGDKALVITPETKALLVQLQEMGMLTLSPDVAATHRTEGYVALASHVSKKPKLDYATARAEWSAVQGELKAVKALNEIGLHEQAAPHVTTVLRGGGKALSALYRKAPDAALPLAAAAEHRSLVTQIREVAACPGAVTEHVDVGLSLAEQVDAQLHG